jgi:hypothetical protein
MQSVRATPVPRAHKCNFQMDTLVDEDLPLNTFFIFTPLHVIPLLLESD